VVPQIPPPPEIWDRIETVLDAPSSGMFTIIEGGRTELESQILPAVEASITDMQALRRSLSRWRAVAAAASALAAALVIFIADREISRHPSVQPSYVAVVNRGGDQPALIVRVDLASGHVFVRPIAAEAPSGKSLELWYIGEGKAPKSMGLIDKGPLRMPLPAGATVDKATFAVTVEPQGGSPTGDPTGPIVYSGQLIKE
jgi:anti-sigma-K factor RskA